MPTAFNKNPAANPIRLLLYLVLIVIAIYQLSQKAREAPVAPKEKEPPGIRYIPAEKIDPSPPTVEPAATERPAHQTTLRGKIRTQVEKQIIRDQNGNVIYSGTIDLSETIARIQRGEELTQFRHDGIVFENREHLLPRHGSGYYREWVHLTPQESGPGPQRVITGENGEFWYTPNHYKTFIKLN